MNAKIMKAAFVAAIAVVASYGVYANLKADNMSDLMLAKVVKMYIAAVIMVIVC